VALYYTDVRGADGGSARGQRDLYRERGRRIVLYL
jgi:hypothetical protein